MKTLLKKMLLLLFVFIHVNTSAQTQGRDFTKIDAYVKSLGTLENMSMGTINKVISNPFTEKIDKVRAIYYWIANNIVYDVKLMRTSGNEKRNTVADVLKTRKANGIGFASLFQDMCSSADIRCLTVDGYVKYNSQQIGEKDLEINHTWAVVQLGQSPEDWYYVDPAFGSGYMHVDMKAFTRSYSDAYFFTEKETFNLQHYPDNEAWKLGRAARNKTDFFNMPVVKTAAIEMEIKKCIPNEGKIKAKVDKAVKFIFTVKNAADVTSVSAGIGEKRKYKVEEIPFSNSGSALSFTYTFKDTDLFPFTIFVNGKEFVQYEVEVD